jgi:hypothetical protein
MKNNISNKQKEQDLLDRIWNAIPVTHQSFLKLLELLEIEITTDIPTACVTTGTFSRLRINPDFAAKYCKTDDKLGMLVMHELFHVLLGHTRLFERITPAQNFAFDAVINSHLCQLFPDNAGISFFRKLYPADDFPFALLRPPDGWRTSAVKWRLEGEALNLHQALYSESSTTYRELYDLITRKLTNRAYGNAGEIEKLMEQLLGSHGAQVAAEETDPDFTREVREIVARWPMHEQRSGRDQGLEAESFGIEVHDARRQLVASIRKSLLPLLDRTGGFSGVARMETGSMETTLPFRSQMDRRAGVFETCGSEPLFYKALSQIPEIKRFEKAHVYLDVSGSMMDELPLLYGALLPLRKWLFPKIHAFSTSVSDIGYEQLKNGKVISTQGTEIDCVTQHMLKENLRRALIITDGWVGEIPTTHCKELGKRRVRVNSLITEDGDPLFAAGLHGTVHRMVKH